MKLSKRERQLIYVLFIVIALAAVILLAQLIDKKLTAKEAELADIEVQANQMRSALASLDTLKTEVPQTQAETEKSADSFNDMLVNREIDTKLTALMTGAGLTPLTMTIADTASAPVAAFAGGVDETNAAVSGYVSRADVSVTASGSPEQIYAFLDALKGAGNAYRVSAFAATETTGSAAYQMSATVSVYMCSASEAMIHGETTGQS